MMLCGVSVEFNSLGDVRGLMSCKRSYPVIRPADILTDLACAELLQIDRFCCPNLRWTQR